MALENTSLELKGKLEDAIGSFNRAWPQHVLSAGAYDVPLYEDGLTPEFIDLELVEGEGAVDRILHALSAFERDPLQHPGAVFRLPGYVCLKREMCDEIDHINTLKDELRQSVIELHSTERARNRFCREVFPQQVMLQIYRHLQTSYAPLEALKFTWSPQTTANRKVTQIDALEMLLRRQIKGTDIPGSPRHKALELAIEEVKSIGPDAQLVIKQPRSPYPIATLYETRGKNAKKSMVPCSLPIFTGPGVGGIPVVIGRLKPFDSNRRNKTRSDIRKDKLVFRPLHLFARNLNVNA